MEKFGVGTDRCFLIFLTGLENRSILVLYTSPQGPKEFSSLCRGSKRRPYFGGGLVKSLDFVTLFNQSQVLRTLML